MFIVGSGQTIEGLDKGVVGMKVGKTKTITIQPEQGYGKMYQQYDIQKIGKVIFDKIGVTLEK
jgi:FKBP-type peptidyl-prolyl cis-trans isomerase 2